MWSPTCRERWPKSCWVTTIRRCSTRCSRQIEGEKALKILFVQETDWLDRNPIIQHHLAERLKARGHDVRIIDYEVAWQKRGGTGLWQPRQVFEDVNRVLEGIHLRVTRPGFVRMGLLCHLSWALSSTIEVWRSVRSWRPDLVVGLTLTNSPLMALALRRLGVPYVCMVLEPYHTMPPQRWVRPFARRVEQFALGRADRVAVFAPKMRDYVQQMGVAPDRVVVFRTVVSLDLFRPDLDGSGQRAALGLQRSDWVLLFLGWLYEFSGLREMVRAICSDPGLLDGATLLIVGDGEILPELAEWVAEHDLTEQVILTGRLPYELMPVTVAAADVGLMPFLENETTRDIGPMKIYEYLASGKPVVAVPLPGISAEFGNGSGVLWAEDPVAALREAVALSRQPEEVRFLGQAGRRKAEEYGDWEQVTGLFERFLLSAADAHTAGH